MTLNPEKSPTAFTFLFCFWSLCMAAALPLWDRYLTLGEPVKGNAVAVAEEMKLIIHHMDDYSLLWQIHRSNFIRLLGVLATSLVVGRLIHWWLWGRAGGPEMNPLE